MKAKVLILMVLTFFGISQFAVAQSGGAGSAHDWRLPPLPEWVRNLDYYDWEYVFGAQWGDPIIPAGAVPRNVKELLDQEAGTRGGDAMIWAYDREDSNVVRLYMRSHGVYRFITISRYWFNNRR